MSQSRPTLWRVDGDQLVAPFAPDAPPQARPDGAVDGAWLQGDAARGTPEPVARAGSALAGLYDLAADIEVSPQHPPTVDREAQALAADPGIDDPELADYCHLPFITIDEVHSKDLDQALYVEAAGRGHKVYYAIADAAHFVRPGGALFDEALRRGSTYYMPGLVLPMLPRLLSEDLVSINPDVDRRALVFEATLDADGVVVSSAMRRARVRSRWKTSYDAVQRFFDGAPVDAPRDGDAIIASLEGLREVGERRLALAAVRDTIRLRRRELSVRLADDELGFVGMADPRNDAERYNEQISLLANVLGARFLQTPDPRLQPIFRFHQAPDHDRLRRFAGQVKALSKRHRLDPRIWRWRRDHESLADFLARLPDGRGAEDRVIQAIHRQAMLAGGRAGFDTAPGIHHGVGAAAYARFTAPMREIVGIFVHKEACEALGLAPAAPGADDEALRERVIQAAERSRGRQRKLDGEINRRLLDQLFRTDLERRDRRGRPATVMGVTRTKVHLLLDDPPIDVKVYMRHLEDQHGRRLVAGRDGVTVRRLHGGRAEWTVGEGVRVRAVEQDRSRDRWRLELLKADRS